jgi:sugar phosphate isomerase/epimerase
MAEWALADERTNDVWTLSGFSDEISDDFAEQCDVVRGLGLRYIEIRSAWGTNILDLSPEQLARVQDLLAEHDLRVSSIGSPIGKIKIGDDFEPHLHRMRHAAEVAKLLAAPYVRIFSFFIPEGEDPDSYRDEVLRRMRALATVAEEAGVILLHENEKDIYGDIPRRCLDVVESVASQNLRLAWDPANFVQVGVRPFTEGYALLRPHVEYIQIKDALLADGAVVVAGEGDGEVVETVRALRADGFDGFFSLEPHLGEFDARGAFSGPQLWTNAWKAFTDILKAEGIEYA